MTTIEQLPEQIDSNVTIEPPAKIEIKYQPNQGWYIKIGEHVVQRELDMGNFTTHETRYFEDAGEPMQYLIDRHLVKTKAYREFDKAIKKVHNKTKSKK